MKIDNFYTEMWLNLYEKACKYNLSETCVKAVTLNELLNIAGKEKQSLLNEMANIPLDYGYITGSPHLRKGILSLYEKMTDENITVAHGGIGANALVLMTLVEPGDHIIAMSPSYQQNYALPKSIGAEISYIYLNEENNWNLDLEKLSNLIRPNTKLICITNPNNPTGSFLDNEELTKIANIARNCGAWIFCDEAYRGLNYKFPHLGTSIADIYEKGISTGSASKTFSSAGLRIGWIAGPKDFIEEIDKRRDYHIISMSSLDDYVASLALENADKLIKRNIEICQKNVQLVENWVNQESHLSFVKPVSGSTAFISYDMDIDSETLCLKLLNDYGVLLVPGKAFDCEYHFRLGFGNSSEEIIVGMENISKYLKTI